jgi:anaerobic selenocysteine-containing dehydrogenase
MIQTACPLDCFDACEVVYDKESQKIVGGSSLAYTNGTLCAHLYKHIKEAQRVTKPMVNGKEVTMSEALDEVAKAIKDNPWLLWRGSGNMGVMQEVTNLLAKDTNGVLTKGTLCDGAGEAGILEGRGINRLLPPSQVAKAEVVVVWGRNIPTTNPHLMPYIKDKTVVVIDPIKTKLAKMANLHLQIKPRCDFYLATILARFVMMEDSHDQEWLEERASEYEEYYDYTRGFRIKAILEHIGLSLDDIGDFLLMLKDKKVVFLVGGGVQRYDIGDSTLRAIDSFAAILGLFGKEGCGVSYLASSRLGFDNPFEVNCKRELKATTPFSKYKSVIVQGGNPAASMPCSNKVEDELKSVENLIYFGLYENKTSKLANIIIPAKSFLEKDDVRLSYGHEYVQKMNKAYDSDIGISEYDFVNEILKRLKLELIEPLDYYIDYWLNQAKSQDGKLITPAYQEIPYEDGFGEDGDDEFEFNDDFYDDFEDIKALQRFRKKVSSSSDSYYLLTPKSNKSLNTQFANEQGFVYINGSLGFRDGDLLKVESKYGKIVLEAKISSDIREDCVVIYMGTDGVNKLTPPISSCEGDSACYGDIKVRLSKN